MRGGRIENDYQLVVSNKSQHEAVFELKLATPAPLELVSATTVSVAAGATENYVMSVRAPENYSQPITAFEVSLCAVEGVARGRCSGERVTFLGPQL